MKIRPLQRQLQEKAIKELNEDPRRIEQALDLLKEWIRKQPHLNIRNDDQMLLAFLRGSKWNLQFTKEKLDVFCSIKTQMPELYEDRDPLSSGIQKVLKIGVVFPMPKAENDIGPTTIISNMKNVDENEITFVDMLKVFFMTLEILMREDDGFVVSGMNFLADHDGCPVSYYLQFTPGIVKNATTSFQSAYPIRTKSMTIINTWTVFETLYNTLMKPFLTPKLRERFQVVSKAQSSQFLKESPLNLPREYGGMNESMTNAAEEWKKKVESYREWFLEDAMYVTNEALRPKVLENVDVVDGSFRSLVID
ncbi:retinol-binding protein pinta-like [Photinus pyralis]|uniref:retinol-binding protein pinta-like n=1 Tax=Photinus pyralis TaxID=7054 RepID=UPI0012670998|nr:retinol-binding protein pinta-like [Photinus pyralis]